MAAAKKVDWERIEPDWRAGIKSVQQLVDEYAAATSIVVSLTAINKHFKKLGVPRDLSKKIQDKADAMVSAAMVSGKVSILTTATDAEIINVNATVLADAIRRHRTGLVKAWGVVDVLMDEL